MAVAITPSNTTGNSHDTVTPPITASLAVNRSGISPAAPSAATATVATTKLPAASVMAFRPVPSVLTLPDIMK